MLSRGWSAKKKFFIEYIYDLCSPILKTEVGPRFGIAYLTGCLER